MNFNFIGINDKIVNLDAIALIEDVSDDDGPKALLTATTGAEIELEGDDAEALFERAEFMMKATDAMLAKMQAVEVIGANQ